MRGLLHSRRGSVAFATVVALIPLIGVVALGGEAGSWYVTRQHAQNAADAAAYSGAVQELCLSNPLTCAVTETVDYRAKQAAAQNSFCNAGASYPGSQCGSSLPSGISQTVEVASLTSWKGTAGIYVQATVSQQQPAYLARVLGLTTVDIGATAVAKVQSLAAPPCVLALTGSVSFQGSPNINAPNCGMASNSTANNAINFTGGGASMNVGSLTTVGGCTGQAQFCDPALTYMPAPIKNPFSDLDGALTTMCGTNPTLPAKCGLTPPCDNKGGKELVPYTAATPCTNDGFKSTGQTVVTGPNGVQPLPAGVYFISGKLTVTAGSSITGTGVTFILLPGAEIVTQGSGTLTLNGPTSVPNDSSFPAALQPSAALFQYMAMYYASAEPAHFGGNSNINLTGNIYAPNADVTFQGNPAIAVGDAGGCGQLIAKSVEFNGNSTFDTTGCPASTKMTSSQYVQLVQ
ncbi:pilus assembly protein TadG-related protein [Bradyrhizobium sp. LjRoot220]|uniref:pilus assembly protein TadG-related protein n=1 Tax=Bradyrhizobium sp. LjRoot220 TaxID=3342284 RepID=UPI003ED0BFF6